MKNIYLLYGSVVVIWGTTWLAIKFQLSQVAPVWSVSYRFGLSALVLFTICIITKKPLRLSFKDHFFLVLQGITLFGGSYYLIYLASQYLTSGLIAVIFSTILMMNILNLKIFYNQHVHLKVLCGGILGFIGICSVFWSEVRLINSSDYFTGFLLAIFATYLASLGNIIAVYNSRENISVTKANAFGMAYGAIFAMILGFMETGEMQFSISVEYIAPLLYLSVFGSVIAFGCYMLLIEKIGADRAAYAIIINPILALALSTFFEEYMWNFYVFIGVILVIIGNIVVLSKSHMGQMESGH